MLGHTTKIIQFFLIFSYFSAGSFAADRGIKDLCPGWILKGDDIPSFSDVEKRLICGDKDGDKVHPNEAWRTIPYTQARYNLINFLQDRGYHHPVFIPKNLDRTEVEVEVGLPTQVSQINVEGTLAPIEIERMRKIKGSKLTPNVLTQVEKWVYDRLRELGYGCPQVESQANPETGEIKIKVIPGPIQPLASVTTEEIGGVEDGILRRYDAFQIGEPFDGTLLSVTENRVGSTKIVDTNRFLSTCDTDGVHLRQTTLAGKPRILTVRFGTNAEGIVLGKVSWQNTRLGKMGSQLAVTASGSARVQTLQSSVNWYVLPRVSRFYLNPLVQFSHTNVQQFESLTAVAQMGVAGTHDFQHIGIDGFVGPTLNHYRTISGIGAPTNRLLSLETRLNIKSHTYEEFSGSPRTGYFGAVTTDVNSKNIYSDVSAQRVNIRGEYLFNYKNYDPPLWIFGTRFGYSTVFADADASTGSTLPATFYQYLGGSTSIRGFGLVELPQDQNKGGFGRLTSGFLGAEIRLSNTLPFNIDPFTFIDFGALGNSSGVFDSPIYWSPGFGLRWASPVGPVRTTLAHGYGAQENHFQFFFSLGEEF